MELLDDFLVQTALKFQGAEMNSPILHNLTLIDSPGVLSGEKQRIGRDYEFPSVIKW